jgi:hypothetical protein
MPEMIHPHGRPGPFSYPRAHDSARTLPRLWCNYGLSVAGILIGNAVEHCGQRTSPEDDIERWGMWDSGSDTIYRHVHLCCAHQVHENDLGIAMSGLLDVIDCGLMVSRSHGLGPIIVKSGVTINDVRPMIGAIIDQGVIEIEHPTADEVAMHMSGEPARPQLIDALERLADLGYLTRHPEGRYAPTAFGRLSANVSRDDLAAAGVL